MSGDRSSSGGGWDLFFIGVLSLAVGTGFVAGLGHLVHEKPIEVAGAIRFSCTNGFFDFDPSTGRLTLRDLKSAPELEADLALSVNGELRALSIKKADVVIADKHAFEAHFPIELSGGHAFAVLRLKSGNDSEDAPDRLAASLTVTRGVHSLERVGLRLLTPTHGSPLFVTGIGEIADLGTASGRIATLDLRERKLGITATHGNVDVTTTGEPDGTFRASFGTGTVDVSRLADSTDMILVGGLGAPLWGQLYRDSGEATAQVNGVVSGTTEQAMVYGLDSEGTPRVVTKTTAGGRFAIRVPKSVTQWYAALDPSRASPAVRFVPGTAWDLRLDVSPGGELVVQVGDPDTKQPLTVRLIVHGVDGTLDPSFGPDYRASGAGPVIDAIHGDVTTPLPAGRYRVAATHGLEWSIDAQTVDIFPGHQTKVALALRHVVATPGVIDADLHVHARPSFDSPVAQEDRVLSLIAAGIEFAIPTEHNIVGDYSPSIESLGARKELATIPGVEITTFSPSFGHFGLFPYPVGKIPPYRNTNVGAVFAAARKDGPERVLVVHHPRLQKGLGYFSIFGFDPHGGEHGEPKVPSTMRIDFDAVEVYNGYEAADSQRVETVLKDYFALLEVGRYAATGSSDSHRIQYNWAGYPRTLVEAVPGVDGLVDPQGVVAAIKHGRQSVTSGPVIDFHIHSGRPGDTEIVEDDAITAHIKVSAAPWIDVSSIEIIASGKSIATIPIASRPTVLGPEPGTLEEAQARAVRYEKDLDLTLPPGARWIVVIARGTRKLDDILPFMPIVPLGFTNPIYLDRGP